MLKKIIAWGKKNQKIIVVILVVLVVSGLLRKIIGWITVLIGSMMTGSKAGPGTDPVLDYDFLAMTIYNDLKLKWFDWSRNNDAVKGVINSLSSTAQFLELSRHYAIKYGEDLREELKKHFTDQHYSELLWK